MEFTCSKEKLLNAINIVMKAVSSKSTSTMLECILIKVEFNSFKLIANNLELAIESSLIECNVVKDGTICLNAKMFSDIIKHLPSDNVKIWVTDNLVTNISSEKSKFKIIGLSSDEFPTIPEVPKENKYMIFSSDLKNMIRQTIFPFLMMNQK